MDQIAKIKDLEQRRYDAAVQSVAGRKREYADPNSAPFARVVRKYRRHIKINLAPNI